MVIGLDIKIEDPAHEQIMRNTVTAMCLLLEKVRTRWPDGRPLLKSVKSADGVLTVELALDGNG